MANKFKKLAKIYKTGDMIIISFNAENVTISNGHTVFKMSLYDYKSNLQGLCAGFPAYMESLDGVTLQTFKKGSTKEISSKLFDEVWKIKEETLTAPASPLLFDIDGKYVRSVIYQIDGIAKGMLVNEDYLQAAKEFLNDSMLFRFQDKKSSPLYTKNKYGREVILLPVFYNDDSEFAEVLRTLTAEAQYSRLKKSGAIA